MATPALRQWLDRYQSPDIAGRDWKAAGALPREAGAATLQPAPAGD
jgi:hypothetical protein